MSRTENQMPLPKGSYILLTLITAYLMFFSVVTNEITAFITLALVIAFCSVFLRARRLALGVGAIAALGFLSSVSFIQTASIVAVVCIIGMGAVSLLHVNKLLVGVSFAVAYGSSLLFTKSPLASATMLLFAFCAILLAVALAKKLRRTSAICLVATGLLIGFAGIFLLSLYRLTGEISMDAFSSLISQFHELLLEIFKENALLLDQNLRAVMTEEAFNEAFDAILCILPAGFIITVSVLAFLSHWLSFVLCSASGYMQKIPEESRPFVLSPVTAVLYIVSLLLMLVAPFVGDDSQILLVTAQNMTLILMPALLLVGWFGIYGFLSQTAGCLNVWVILGMVLLVVYSRGLLLYPLSLVGVYLTFRVNRGQPPQE